MITVKLFGTMSLEMQGSNQIQINLPEGTVEQVLRAVAAEYAELDIKKLKKAVVFVNGKQIHQRRPLSAMLKDGDELALMSPAGGG